MKEKIKKVIYFLNEIPPAYEAAERFLAEHTFSAEDLACIAYEVSSECFLEYRDALYYRGSSVSLHTLHSAYLYDTLEFLLEKGLNPNTVYDDNNHVLWEVINADAPNLAGKTLRLLLEHGGNPNHRLPNSTETLFEEIDFQVSYDRYTHEYLNIVQAWFVLMAYGGCYKDGKISLTMIGNNTVAILKDFERFDFYIEYLPPKSNRVDGWIMHIFDIETNEEVARYR